MRAARDEKGRSGSLTGGCGCERGTGKARRDGQTDCIRYPFDVCVRVLLGWVETEREKRERTASAKDVVARKRVQESSRVEENTNKKEKKEKKKAE